MKIDATHRLQDETQSRVGELTTGGANVDLLRVLFEQPYCRINDVIKACQVSRPTAIGWLNALVADQALRSVRVGRERLFINSAFVEVLMRDERVAEKPVPTLF